MAAPAGGSFSDPEPILERLRQGPGEEARREMAVTDTSPPPSRWTLRTIRATFDIFSDLTLSGIWRSLGQRFGLSLRSGQVQQYSPDPEYMAKCDYLIKCLNEAATMSDRVALVFLDEMGYARWPEAAPDWTGWPPAPRPTADRAQSPNRLWRIIGALNAVTGRVDFLDAYIVGRAKVIQFYKQLDAAYPDVERLLVVQDNWSIHTHEDVLGALKQWPRIEPVWLPTYSPWLNPIEKLWRWLRQDVLKLHRLAGDWPSLRGRVNQFLGQFATGSQDLLRYVGLLGQGKLAQALQVPP
jgi:transposase